MKTFRFRLITPEGEIFRDQIVSLTAPGTEGSFGILAGHTPMVASLTKGVLTLLKENEPFNFMINTGVLEVDWESHVLLLSDAAVPIKSEDVVNKMCPY